jgi:hypothetical protein
MTAEESISTPLGIWKIPVVLAVGSGNEAIQARCYSIYELAHGSSASLGLQTQGSSFFRPVPCAVIDAEYLYFNLCESINNDEGQPGNHQLSSARDSSDSASTWQKIQAIGGFKQRLCNFVGSGWPVSLDIFGNLFKISGCRLGPSYLCWVRRLWTLGFQCPLDPSPNLGRREELATICSINSRLDGRMKMSLIRDKAVDSLSGQLVDSAARLRGNLCQLRFLLGGELDGHGLKVGRIVTGVKSPFCRRETIHHPEGLKPSAPWVSRQAAASAPSCPSGCGSPTSCHFQAGQLRRL